MSTTMIAQPLAARFDASASDANPLRPVLLTVLSLKVAVAAFLLVSVSLAPPLSAESRYLAGSTQVLAAN